MEIQFLKIRAEYLRAVLRGEKTNELRPDDRGFMVGQLIQFVSLAKEHRGLTDVPLYVITHILRDFKGLEKGYCILSIKLATWKE